MDDLANVGTGSQPAQLLARDAFSGLPLWKINCEGTYSKVQLDWRNVWPLAATERRVYAARATDLVIVDAATGSIEAACPNTRYLRRSNSLCSSHVLRCLRQSATAHIRRAARSPTTSRPPSVDGRNRIASWISGASSVRFMICVMRGRET